MLSSSFEGDVCSLLSSEAQIAKIGPYGRLCLLRNFGIPINLFQFGVFVLIKAYPNPVESAGFCQKTVKVSSEPSCVHPMTDRPGPCKFQRMQEDPCLFRRGSQMLFFAI